MATTTKQPYYYLVALHVKTGDEEGDNGINGGEIVEFSWVVINSGNGEQVDQKYVFVHGTNQTDQDQAFQQPGSTTLQEAVQQFDSYLYTNFISLNKSFCLLTDGTRSLKEKLIPEAVGKDIKLAAHYAKYFDLRKEFGKRFGKNRAATNSLEHMAEFFKIPTGNSRDSLDICRTIGKVAESMIHQGHRFAAPDIVPDSYFETTIKSNSATQSQGATTVVRIRGLPWQATDRDVEEFFRGLKILSNGIIFAVNSFGRATGEAYVEFETESETALALQRDRQSLGHRYIEVFESNRDELEHAKSVIANKNNSHSSTMDPAGEGSSDGSFVNTIVIKMRGLPFSATTDDIVKFFDGLEIQENGIHLVTRPDGRHTGEAFVEFANEGSSRDAMSRHKEKIGARYIELFRSSKAEMGEVLNRHGSDRRGGYRDSRSGGGYNRGYDSYDRGRGGYNHDATSPYSTPNSNANSSNMINHTNARRMIPNFSNYVVRLRGLPYSANELDIANFLSDVKIAAHGIHLVFNTQDRPTGEAFVELVSADEINQALTHHKQQMGNRYIEIFPSGKEDMLAACNGGDYPPANSMTPPPPSYNRGGYPDHQYNGGYNSGYNSYNRAPQNQYFPMGTGYDSRRPPPIPSYGATQHTGHNRYFGHPQTAMPTTTAYAGYGTGAPTVGMGPTHGGGGYGGGGNINPPNDGCTLKMRGVPFRATAGDILDFFDRYKVARDGVRLLMDRDGRASGEAYVTFVSPDEASRAVRDRNNASMGTRYIELFMQ